MYYIQKPEVFIVGEIFLLYTMLIVKYLENPAKRRNKKLSLFSLSRDNYLPLTLGVYFIFFSIHHTHTFSYLFFTNMYKKGSR